MIRFGTVGNSLNLADVIFKNGIGYDALYASTANTNVVATNLQFLNNAAQAIQVGGGLQLSNSLFRGNTFELATLYGPNPISLTNIQVDGNSFNSLAGGNVSMSGFLDLFGSGPFLLANSTFANNTGTGNLLADIVHLSGTGVVTISNTTFENNSTSGSPEISQDAALVAAAAPTTVVRNTTLYGNVDSGGVTDLITSSVGTLTVVDSILAGQSGVAATGTCTGCINGGNNLIGVDPLMVGLGSYSPAGLLFPSLTDLPQPASAAVCGGVLATDTLDARGYARGVNGCYAIGATQPAYAIAIVQQPSTTTVGGTITPAPSAQVTEHAVNIANVPLTATLATGSISGTTTQTTDSTGTATFANLVPNTGGQQTLTLNDGLLTVTSAAFTAAPGTPTVLLAVSQSAQTYGVVPTGTFTGTVTFGSKSVAGTFVYKATTGGVTATITQGTTLLNVGTYSVVATFTPTDANSYSTASSSASTYTVNATTTPITLTVPNHTVGDAPFTVAATSASTDAFTYSVVSGPATVSGNTVALTGAGTVVLQAAQAAAGNYAGGTAQATFTVSPVGSVATTTTVTSSSNPSATAQSIVLTATVAATGASPTGTVIFSEGSTVLATVTLTSGTATYTSATLSTASHTITAVYQGSSTNGASTGTITQVVIAFTIADNGSTAPAAVTLTSGGTAAVPLALNPGAGFNGTITLSCTGLPVNTTCTFSPNPVVFTAGGAAQNISLTLKATTATASLERFGSNGALASRLAMLFWLPTMLLAGLGARSRKLSGANRLFLFAMLAMSFAAAGVITGCGGNASTSSSTVTAANSAPKGTTAAAVVATSGSTSTTLPLTITVQ